MDGLYKCTRETCHVLVEGSVYCMPIPDLLRFLVKFCIFICTVGKSKMAEICTHLRIHISIFDMKYSSLGSVNGRLSKCQIFLDGVCEDYLSQLDFFLIIHTGNT